MSTATATTPAIDPFEMTATAGGGGDKELPPSGNLPGVCIGLIHAGTHSETFSDGNVKDVQKHFILFETPGVNRQNGQPFVLVMEATGTFGTKSNLRKMVEGWRNRAFAEGETFNVKKLLGQKCLCNVAHKKTTKGNDVANLIGVSSVPQGMTVAGPTRSPFVYTVLSGDPPPEEDWIPWSFGNSIADVCRDSREWKAAHGGPTVNAAANGSAPTATPQAASIPAMEPGAGAIEDDLSDIPF